MSNIFSFIGTVGKDAEVKYTPSGVAVLVVSMANQVGYGDKQKTNWVRVNVWGKRAEGELVNYLKKGQQAFVSGELSQGEYTTRDGEKKTLWELNATVLDLVGKKADTAQKAPVAAPQKPPQPPHDNFDDGIPF
ncbi:single-stranded DNA-binding protein [Crenothrix polyspora]|uniref:Single-stranded DNA-binding protein n=1 Tax=Crenothrix polyspora TaxID=360316 RepID=A0A1R4H168_9GAMM|nr:single-stranded DNA-binding protein [Crenothrix polyspora]SJM89993.1 Single-stranded DNA-binding protein [Crenothrix polyspora]